MSSLVFPCIDSTIDSVEGLVFISLAIFVLQVWGRGGNCDRYYVTPCYSERPSCPTVVSDTVFTTSNKWFYTFSRISGYCIVNLYRHAF